ncbi:fimbria/pilus outer membrane usher protein [Pseudorhodobacter ferrugineus]|uniref:fimbria/pilus outer membrane usher protein n=1 Tax=Pseudorhodobacter ferrugineus TaxID=77008 RepID=UPI0003B61AE7|nr:fimbria/pilus outer membrane usher protein [Pseudorhodobacter ferrugineus]
MNNLSPIITVASAFFLCGWGSVPPVAAQAQDEMMVAPSGSPLAEAGMPYDPDTDEALFLLVTINGRDIELIAEFSLSPDTQRMMARRDELDGIGIMSPRALGQSVYLDQIPGLTYVYDAVTQAIHIAAHGPALIPVELSARPDRDIPDAQTGYGLVLNYRVTANLGDNILVEGFRTKDAFAAFDLRAFTPLGVLTTTGTASSRQGGSDSANFRRHDTYFTVSSPVRMLTLTAGDFTTSGPAWARPVRLGGVQIRRDFSLRDDVMTNPLLSFSGSPTVPSSIEVYVDNVRAYSGAVSAGPFNLSHVPMITGSGEAVFVLRDAGGNETTTLVPFFATQNLLAKGMLDYSLEAGRVRLSIGDGDMNYAPGTAAAVSLRYGVSSRLTVEARAEIFKNLKMAGIGVHAVMFNRAEVTLAGGKSAEGKSTGGFLFGALRTEVRGVGVRFSTRRTFGTFRDLASATQRQGAGADLDLLPLPILGPVQAMDALSLAFPVFADGGQLGLNLITSARSGLTNTLLSASYVQSLPKLGSYRINAFKDFTGDGGFGLAVGMSIPLGAARHATVSVRRDRSERADLVASLSKTADRKAGSYGYRVNLSRQNRQFGATYQTAYGRADVILRDRGQGTSASATFDGALVLAGGGLFASNRIHDGFAVVNLGHRDVAISLNNREVARTGASGKALVPDLRSYRLNRISINPLDLPIDANIEATAMNVVTARHSGVALDFGGTPEAAALVVLRDAAGAFLPPGSEVRLRGSSNVFVVGYDGEAWITGLDPSNQITAQTPKTKCSAAFDYTKQSEAQVYIDGVTCE